MKKIIKNAEVELICKVNNLDAEAFATGIYWLNRGDSDMLLKEELNATAIYLVTREIMTAGVGGMTSNAREICSKIDRILNRSFGYTRSLVMGETLKYDRKLIAELNMGLNHITITDNNPYVKGKA